MTYCYLCSLHLNHRKIFKTKFVIFSIKNGSAPPYNLYDEKHENEPQPTGIAEGNLHFGMGRAASDEKGLELVPISPDSPDNASIAQPRSTVLINVCYQKGIHLPVPNSYWSVINHSPLGID